MNTRDLLRQRRHLAISRHSVGGTVPLGAMRYPLDRELRLVHVPNIRRHVYGVVTTK